MEFAPKQILARESNGTLLLFNNWQCLKKFDRIPTLGFTMVKTLDFSEDSNPYILMSDDKAILSVNIKDL